MLGPLKMDVRQCLEAYRAMAKKAFTPIRHGIFGFLPYLPGNPTGAFSGTSLAEAVKDIVQKYKGDREALFADRSCCKVNVAVSNLWFIF